jgi:hypothetical protein
VRRGRPGCCTRAETSIARASAQKARDAARPRNPPAKFDNLMEVQGRRSSERTQRHAYGLKIQLTSSSAQWPDHASGRPVDVGKLDRRVPNLGLILHGFEDERQRASALRPSPIDG